jgi:hypothetical protein
MDLDAVRVKRKMQLLDLDEWEKKHIIIQRFIKRESRDGMTRGSRRRSSPLEIRYYFLILG